MPGGVLVFMPVSWCCRHAIPSMYLLSVWSMVLSKVKKALTAHGDWALGARGAGGCPCAQGLPYTGALGRFPSHGLTVLPKFVGLGHMAVRHK